MGNYEQLKQSVSDVIKTNGNQEITGSILQNVLLTIISTVGANATFAGIATPATNPGTPDGPVFYLASESGTYTNFNATELQDGLSVLMWDGSWSSQQIFGIDDEPTAGSDNLVKSGGIASAYGSYIENPEFAYVKTDKEGRILWAIKTDGSVYYGAGVPPQVVNYIREKIKELSLDEYEDIVTFLGNLIEGDKTLQELLNEKVDKVVGKGLIDSEFSNNVSYEENPEFATAEVDSEKKLLGGRKLNGIRFEKIGFETPLLLIGGNQFHTYNDTENRETLIVDKDNKVVSFRDKNGVLHENAGIKTTLLNASNLILSEEGVKNLIDLLHSKGLKDKNNWKNKNIWWCGTSIPAAGYWNVNNTFSYPYMVGEQLGAKKVFNEAVGSSCARKLTYTNSIYEVISRQMGNTISDALAICADTWTIDDANQTVTNGPRTLGITDIPTVSTYSDACYQRMLLLSNSYEIKLVSKYLISDPDENESYLREKFGLLYEALVALHPTAYTYQSDIDLFVIDHGHNDDPTTVPTEDVDSLVMTTFIGAINNYISLIMKYKPHARIVFISDYDNSRLTSKTIEAQKQIATNWHIPFIDLREYLPFNINVKAKTRGYWVTDGIWQEDGFIYDSTAADVAHAFSVNGNAYFPSYVGTTIQEIAEHINPQQDSNGIWWYEYEPRYIYIKDGLHPHTDKSGKCLKLYADVLASFINYIGNNII